MSTPGRKLGSTHVLDTLHFLSNPVYYNIYANPIAENVALLPNMMYYDYIEFDKKIRDTEVRYVY